MTQVQATQPRAKVALFHDRYARPTSNLMDTWHVDCSRKAQSSFQGARDAFAHI